MADDWSVQGTYFEACNCDIPCPCIFLRNPSKGYCQALVNWQIDNGHFNGTTLDDLNVSLFAHIPGFIADGNWTVDLYIDERADDKQRDAIGQIWGGKVGGHLAIVATLIGEVRSVEFVPIEYNNKGKKRTVKVGTVGEIDMDEVEGEGGRSVMVLNHPLAVSPGNPATVHSSNKAVYTAQGEKKFNVSGLNGRSAPFSYQPDA